MSRTLIGNVKGEPGKDGVSPVISVTAITGGYRITITDATGTHTMTMMNGADGEDGKDYVLTEADKQEIAGMVEVPSGGGGSGIIVSDSAPEDTSVLWVDPTDNTIEVPENSGKKSVISYNSPTEVPLESGSQYILYGSTGGTISVQVGNNEINKVDYQLASGFDIVWLLYIKTSDVQGSIIATSGTRKVINFEGDSSKMKISSTIPVWIVIKVG